MAIETPEHDAIFLDDMSFQDLDQPAILALIEREDPRTVRVLHGSVEKPEGLIQIFAFNRTPF